MTMGEKSMGRVILTGKKKKCKISKLDLKYEIEVPSINSENSKMLREMIYEKRNNGDMREKYDVDNIFNIRMNK